MSESYDIKEGLDMECMNWLRAVAKSIEDREPIVDLQALKHGALDSANQIERLTDEVERLKGKVTEIEEELLESQRIAWEG